MAIEGAIMYLYALLYHKER